MPAHTFLNGEAEIVGESVRQRRGEAWQIFTPPVVGLGMDAVDPLRATAPATSGQKINNAKTGSQAIYYYVDYIIHILVLNNSTKTQPSKPQLYLNASFKF